MIKIKSEPQTLSQNGINDNRKWVKLPLSEKNETSSSTQEFRFMTYNILADDLLDMCYKTSKNCNQNLKIARYDKILEELELLKPDIACFQEVQDDEYLLDRIKKIGYSYKIKKRRNKTEGCCTIWRDTFEYIDYYFLVHNSFNDSTIFCKDNVSQVLVLSRNQEYYIVGNTHVLFNYKRGDIKLAQLYITLKAMNFAYEKIKTSESKVNFLLAGDFNSASYSYIYEFLTKGSIDISWLARDNVRAYYLIRVIDIWSAFDVNF